LTLLIAAGQSESPVFNQAWGESPLHVEALAACLAAPLGDIEVDAEVVTHCAAVTGALAIVRSTGAVAALPFSNRRRARSGDESSMTDESTGLSAATMFSPDRLPFDLSAQVAP
jgi:hypothetical protein